jgi:hypothetical protein
MFSGSRWIHTSVDVYMDIFLDPENSLVLLAVIQAVVWLRLVRGFDGFHGCGSSEGGGILTGL